MDKQEIKETLEQIKGDLGIVSAYFKIYREECEKHPTRMSPGTDILGKEGIDVLIGAIENTSANYFKGEKAVLLEAYAVELAGFIQEIEGASPEGPVYTDKDTEQKRMHPKAGNVLAEKLKKTVQEAWKLLPK